MDDNPHSRKSSVRYGAAESRDLYQPRSRWSASTISTMAPAIPNEPERPSKSTNDPEGDEDKPPPISKVEENENDTKSVKPAMRRSDTQQTSGSIPIILQVEEDPLPVPKKSREEGRLSLKEPKPSARKHPSQSTLAEGSSLVLSDAPSSASLRSKFFVEDSRRRASSSAGSSRLPTPVASPPQRTSRGSSPAKRPPIYDTSTPPAMPSPSVQLISPPTKPKSPIQSISTSNFITSTAKNLVSSVGSIRSPKSRSNGAYQRVEEDENGAVPLTRLQRNKSSHVRFASGCERESLGSSYDFVTPAAKVPFDREKAMLEAKGHLTGGLGSGMNHVLELKTEDPDEINNVIAMSPIKPSSGWNRKPSIKHPRSLIPGRPPQQNPAQEAAERSGLMVAVPDKVDVDISNLEGHQTALGAASDSEQLTDKVQQSYYFPPDPQMPDWRPVPMRLWYCLILISIGLVIVGIQEYLCQRSRMSKTGLLKFEAAEQVSSGDWFVWKYLPTIILVSYGVAWQAVEFEVRRLEPFYQLSKPTGATAAESLNIDYLTFWSYLVPFRAFRHRQWAVFLASIATLLSTALVPVLQSASLTLEVRGSKHIKEVIVSPVWSRITEASLVIIAILGVLLVFQIRRKSGLLSNPKGIAGVAAMASRSHILNDFKDLDMADNPTIHRQLRHRRYILHKSSLWQGEYIKSSTSKDVEDVQKQRNPHPMMLRLKWGLPCFICLALFLILIPIFMFTPANIVVVNAPWLLTLYATLLKTGWTNLETAVRLIEPFYILSRRHAPPSILTTDYTGTLPGWMPIKALLARHYLLALVGTCSFLTEVLTVCAASLNVNGRAFSNGNTSAGAGYKTGDAETFRSFWISLSLALVILIVLLATAVLVYFRRRHHFLPRQPGTIASVLAFIHQSRMLYDFVSPADEHEVNGRRIEELDTDAMTRHLEGRGKKYGLGWYRGRDGRDHLGVDEEELLAGYEFGRDWRKGRVGVGEVGRWEVY